MLAFSLFRRKKSLQSVSKHTVSSIFISRITKQPKIFKISAVSLYLAPWRGLEPPVYRLGEPLNICHLCSPMYRKVAIRQAFFVFRVAPCSSKFTGVVRCSPVHFSSFLDFSKKGNKNIFHLPPILAHFEQKSICSRTASLNRISHISLKCTRWGR